MPKWEYMVVDHLYTEALNLAKARKQKFPANEDYNQLLNSFGRDGWEIVRITQGEGGEPLWCLFKREAS